MTLLSGLVAILDEKGAIVGTKDLGAVPVQVKGNVIPLVEQKAAVADDEMLGEPVDVIEKDRVVRTYPAIKRPPEPESLESRLAKVEARLTALEGGVRTDAPAEGAASASLP